MNPRIIAAVILIVATLIVLRYALYHLFPMLLGAIIALLLWHYYSRKEDGR